MDASENYCDKGGGSGGERLQSHAGRIALASQTPISEITPNAWYPPPALTTVALLKFGKTCVGYSDEFRNPEKRILASPLLSTQTAGRKQGLAGQPA